MKKLHDRGGIFFSLLWIFLYIVLFSAADGISQKIGIPRVISAPLALLMCLYLYLWLHKHNLSHSYGLCKWHGAGSAYLYFFPFLLLVSVNLWWGLSTDLPFGQVLLFIVTMVCVGFLEEIIFRGFLFQALCKEHPRHGILISSLTFGIGHILNLLNGSPVPATLIQVVYATAVGFVFTVCFLKTGSLWPCILTHSAVNGLSVFTPQDLSLPAQLLSAGFLCIVSLAYAIYLLRGDSATHTPTNQ